MSQVECSTCKDFMGRCNEYGMQLDQQVTEITALISHGVSVEAMKARAS
jgi:hypothetical protein